MSSSPSLDTAGSFRHSQKYATTAARYARALERERSLGETSSANAEDERLLTTSGSYVERQRAKNEKYRSTCARWTCATVVAGVFVFVAVLGVGHFSGKFDASRAFAKRSASPAEASSTEASSRASEADVASVERGVDSWEAPLIDANASPADAYEAATSFADESAETSSSAAEYWMRKTPPPAAAHPPHPPHRSPPPPHVEREPLPTPMERAMLARQSARRLERHRHNDLSQALLGASRDRVVRKFCPVAVEEESAAKAKGASS